MPTVFQSQCDGLTRLGIKSESTASETDALTTRPSETDALTTRPSELFLARSSHFHRSELSKIQLPVAECSITVF